LTHDSRTLLPYPIYAARASGAHKWDVEGNEYVDYFSGIVLLEAIRESMP
jgi:glutamate-1-semialdehyde 2,1-aminomutase